jgi:hypothetical protein
MRRIDVRRHEDHGGKQLGKGVVLTGDTDEGELRMASEDDVTFPAVWVAEKRVYDVEVWQDGELVATVPPQSDEVDAAFDEHERRGRL